ncbi:MAG TPA: ATP-binding cassette domain-containing protein [Gemmatimonadales bacterium]|nr:ATP-binding cassette domain-containing protein [Gemmatimonadales bacterium]
MTAALELRAIEKRFGPVHALRGADFTLAAGEVHALLGENGAGKSTLMNVAGGLVKPDAGSITVRGVPHVVSSPRAARRAGIGMVHQHFTAIAALSVADNVALSAGWPVSSPRDVAARVLALADRTGLSLEPDALTGTLPVGARQRLEILKALAADATILLLDEPTAVLAPAEADEVLSRLRAFAAQGGSAVLVTHKLDEALAAADRITVLRNGRVVHSGPARGETASGLAAAMLGHAPESAAPRNPTARPVSDQVAISAEDLALEREDGRGVAVLVARLQVRVGEIVGVAGIEGSGQRELLRAVAGLIPPKRGSLSVARPVAFIPEDRTTEGLIRDMTLAENVALGMGAGAPWVRRGRIDWRTVRRRTGHLLSRFRIRASDIDAPAGSLSGGNQQKLVVARALELAPRVVVAENPTRGLDLQAAQSVWAELRRAADADAAVLAWSSDLDEILASADRLIVVARGSVREAPPRVDRSMVGAMMLAQDSGT